MFFDSLRRKKKSLILIAAIMAEILLCFWILQQIVTVSYAHTLQRKTKDITSDIKKSVEHVSEVRPDSKFDKMIEEYQEELNRWKGPVLSKSAGAITGPSGKETYYNLDMSGVVKLMRGVGNADKYWVRDDGCKMLGDYIMVAANLDLRPRGSIVETSLGEGIVCDTGGFAKRNPKQIDIATTW